MSDAQRGIVGHNHDPRCTDCKGQYILKKLRKRVSRGLSHEVEPHKKPTHVEAYIGNNHVADAIGPQQ